MPTTPTAWPMYPRSAAAISRTAVRQSRWPAVADRHPVAREGRRLVGEIYSARSQNVRKYYML